MNTLALALVLPLLVAAAFGALLGLSTACGRSEFVSGEWPLLDALLKRRHPVVNAMGALSAWAIVLYVVPRLSFVLFGVEDPTAFGLSFALQLCILAVAFLVAERVWDRIA